MDVLIWIWATKVYTSIRDEPRIKSQFLPYPLAYFILGPLPPQIPWITKKILTFLEADLRYGEDWFRISRHRRDPNEPQHRHRLISLFPKNTMLAFSAKIERKTGIFRRSLLVIYFRNYRVLSPLDFTCWPFEDITIRIRASEEPNITYDFYKEFEKIGSF